MSTPFDTLSAARSLEASGIESKQAEAIVGAIRASVEASVTKTDLTASTNELRGEMKALATELRGEISSAVNRMLLAQLANPLLRCCLLRCVSLGRRPQNRPGRPTAPLPSPQRLKTP